MRPGFKSNQRRESREEGQMIYGLRPVMEALEAGKEIEKIYLGRTAKGELMQELKTMLKEREIVWQEVPMNVSINLHEIIIRKLFVSFHRFIIFRSVSLYLLFLRKGKRHFF